MMLSGKLALLQKITVGTKVVLKAVKTNEGMEVVKITRLIPPNNSSIEPPEVVEGSVGEPVELRVKWFDQTKGYGFLVGAPENKDVYVHTTVLYQCDIRCLGDGQRVLCSYGRSVKGDGLTAVHIRIAT